MKKHLGKTVPSHRLDNTQIKTEETLHKKKEEKKEERTDETNVEITNMKHLKKTEETEKEGLKQVQSYLTKYTLADIYTIA